MTTFTIYFLYIGNYLLLDVQITVTKKQKKKTLHLLMCTWQMAKEEKFITFGKRLAHI